MNRKTPRNYTDIAVSIRKLISAYTVKPNRVYLYPCDFDKVVSGDEAGLFGFRQRDKGKVFYDDVELMRGP